MLEKIKSHINQSLQSLKNENIIHLSSYLSHGKMLRSKLILAIAPNHPKVLELCAIIEMIQSASLLHDDVIDEATSRRGEASINAVFGNKNAIMLGDVFYSQAFYELLSFDIKIARSVAKCVVRLSSGEIDDVMMSNAFQSDERLYWRMISDKTASLIATSSECAAILEGLDFEKYKNYGENLGIAFQIVDDILDVFGDEKKLGKPAMSDFKEGKSTLPYLLLYEKLNNQDKQKLKSFFRQDGIEAREWILARMNENNIFDLAQKIARDYGQKALKAISKEKNEHLESIVNEMIFRQY